jgi:hypothetical protein
LILKKDKSSKILSENQRIGNIFNRSAWRREPNPRENVKEKTNAMVE